MPVWAASAEASRQLQLKRLEAFQRADGHRGVPVQAGFPKMSLPDPGGQHSIIGPLPAYAKPHLVSCQVRRGVADAHGASRQPNWGSLLGECTGPARAASREEQADESADGAERLLGVPGLRGG